MSQPAANNERELLIVSDAIRRGMTTREIATVLYGEAAVSAEWSDHTPMRTRTRRLVHRARQRMRDEHPGPVDGP